MNLVCRQLFLQIVTVCEIYILLYQHCWPGLAHTTVLGLILPNGNTSADLYPSPIFLLGLVMAVCGTALRLQCHRHLGPNFTFDLTIRKDHVLLTTGPYAVVRHPSYTAAILYGLSHGLCHFGIGSWWLECGIWETTVGWLLASVFLTWHLELLRVILKRWKVEDEMLKQVFGKEWVAWAEKTPYAVLPYVY